MFVCFLFLRSMKMNQANQWVKQGYKCIAYQIRICIVLVYLDIVLYIALQYRETF